MQPSPFTVVLGRWWGGFSDLGPNIAKERFLESILTTMRFVWKESKPLLQHDQELLQLLGQYRKFVLVLVHSLLASLSTSLTSVFNWNAATTCKLKYFIPSLTTYFSFNSCTFSHIYTVQQFRSCIYVYIFFYWPFLTERDVSYYC